MHRIFLVISMLSCISACGRPGGDGPLAGEWRIRFDSLTVPTLAVQAAGGEDRATWGALSVAAQLALERSTDAGASWERVTPWLPETITDYAVPDGSGAARSYRLLLRSLRGQVATGSAVTPS